MRLPYRVYTAGRCGDFWDLSKHEEFGSALKSYVENSHREALNPRGIRQPVMLCNLDNVDLGWSSGLTDDEIETMECAV